MQLFACYLKEIKEQKKKPTCPAISGAEPCIGSKSPGP